MVKDCRLAFFFTAGMSLRGWEKAGMLTREVAVINHLAKRMKRMYLFTYGGIEERNYAAHFESNVEIIPSPIRSAKAYSLLLPFIHLRLLRRCDLLRTNQMSGAWTALLAKLITGGKLIVRNGHSWSLQTRDEGGSICSRAGIWLVETICYGGADMILIAFREGIAYVARRYAVPAGRILYAPNGVDTQAFKPVRGRKAGVLFIGRLVVQKNIENLIVALHDTDIELTIVGDGPLRQSLERLAHEQRVVARFLGTVPHEKLPAILNGCAVFVLPSHYECMPKSLLEAMSCGCAVVGTFVRGTREIIADERNGVLCKGDPASLKSVLSSLLSDAKRRRRLGIAARTTILQGFDLSAILDKECAMYDVLQARYFSRGTSQQSQKV